LLGGPANSGPESIKPVKFEDWTETDSKLSRKSLYDAEEIHGIDPLNSSTEQRLA